MLALEQWIDRYECEPGRSRAEAGDDGLRALFKIDRKALAALQSDCCQAGGQAIDRRLQSGVGETLVDIFQRQLIGASIGLAQRQLVQEYRIMVQAGGSH